jgi:hypothetical protein
MSNPKSHTEPEARHRACWYGRRTTTIPDNLGVQTIEDGQLLYCGHPMWFPIVGYRFDLRNCAACDFFKSVRAIPPSALTTGQ